MTDIRSILNARDKTHGNYAEQARLADRIKNCMMFGAQWINLSPVQRESLHIIAVKLSRILTGDPNHVDSWLDIAGYAVLSADELKHPAHGEQPTETPVVHQPSEPQELRDIRLLQAHIERLESWQEPSKDPGNKKPRRAQGSGKRGRKKPAR